MGQTSEPRVDLPESIREEVEHRVGAGLVELPTLPDRGQKVLSIDMDGDGFDPAELTRFIESDPAMSAQLLRIANSVFYAPRSPINSLQQAIARLGSKRVREIILITTMKTETFAMPGLEKIFARRFQTAVAAAFFAQEAARLKRISVEEAFLFGLFHNIGEVALLREVSSLARMSGVTLNEDCFEGYCALHGPKVGAVTCRSWKLSDRLATAIEHQADPASATEHPDAAALCSLGALAAHTWMQDREASLRDAFQGHASLDLLDFYPDDIAALENRRDDLADLMETI